jgi:hypothetical protein
LSAWARGGTGVDVGLLVVDTPGAERTGPDVGVDGLAKRGAAGTAGRANVAA